MKRIALLLAGLGLSASGISTLSADAKAPVYTLHEWGTFTSVFGSDGRMLPGLQREEETLPPFVHGHAGMGRPAIGITMGTKGWLRPLHNVTVKMETPVIYFYSDEEFKVHVDVGFKGGSISQWYPRRSSGETPPRLKRQGNGRLKGGDIDFAKGYQGSISWEVDVLQPSPLNESLVFVGPETPTWLYPRMTDANVLRHAEGEHEKYLFYRGLFSSLLSGSGQLRAAHPSRLCQ